VARWRHEWPASTVAIAFGKMPEIAASPVSSRIHTGPALRWLGNSDPSTAPSGNVASSPSTSTQAIVSQRPGLPITRPVNRKAPVSSVIATANAIYPEMLTTLPSR
jgi:hypothetical protein